MHSIETDVWRQHCLAASTKRWLRRCAPYRVGTAGRTERSIRLRSGGAATRGSRIGSHSGPQPVSVLPKRKLLSPDGCRRRASSFWPVAADPEVALPGHAHAWRFVSIQESTLLVTRTGSILVRAPSPPGGACRLVTPSVANITGQAYARAWTNWWPDHRPEPVVLSVKQMIVSRGHFWRLSELSDGAARFSCPAAFVARVCSGHFVSPPAGVIPSVCSCQHHWPATRLWRNIPPPALNTTP